MTHTIWAIKPASNDSELSNDENLITRAHARKRKTAVPPTPTQAHAILSLLPSSPSLRPSLRTRRSPPLLLALCPPTSPPSCSTPSPYPLTWTAGISRSQRASPDLPKRRMRSGSTSGQVVPASGGRGKGRRKGAISISLKKALESIQGTARRTPPGSFT